MMDQQTVHEKPEAAFGLLAGVEPEFRLVTVEGDNTTHSGSGRVGETRDLGAAVTGFSVLHRKKRMPRQRRSSTIQLLSFAPSTSHVPPFPLQGLPSLPARVSFFFFLKKIFIRLSFFDLECNILNRASIFL